MTPQLSVSQVASVAVADVNDNLQFTETVDNAAGDSPAYNTTVCTGLPGSQVSIGTIRVNPGTVTASTSSALCPNSVDLDVGQVNAGETETITWTVLVTGSQRTYPVSAPVADYYSLFPGPSVRVHEL